jgi:hypothetical protein
MTPWTPCTFAVSSLRSERTTNGHELARIPEREETGFTVEAPHRDLPAGVVKHKVARGSTFADLCILRVWRGS